MIRNFKNDDIEKISAIWLKENLKAHSFISEDYWKSNFSMVKAMLPDAEVYVYEENGKVCGFIGINGSYIEGIFVESEKQSKGIGRELLSYAKEMKSELSLNVYRKNERAVSFYEREGFEIKSESIDRMTGEEDLEMLWVRQPVFL